MYGFDPTITFVTQPSCFGQTGQITWMANGGGQVLNPTTITNNTNNLVLFSQSTLPNQIYNQSLSMVIMVYMFRMSMVVLIFLNFLFNLQIYFQLML